MKLYSNVPEKPVILGNETIMYKPFIYYFEDVFGHKELSNLFASKLLYTQKGNCNSMLYLLAEEIEDYIIMGELSLYGSLQPIKGVLPIQIVKHKKLVSSISQLLYNCRNFFFRLCYPCQWLETWDIFVQLNILLIFFSTSDLIKSI